MWFCTARSNGMDLLSRHRSTVGFLSPLASPTSLRTFGLLSDVSAIPHHTTLSMLESRLGSPRCVGSHQPSQRLFQAAAHCNNAIGVQVAVLGREWHYDEGASLRLVRCHRIDSLNLGLSGLDSLLTATYLPRPPDGPLQPRAPTFRSRIQERERATKRGACDPHLGVRFRGDRS